MNMQPKFEVRYESAVDGYDVPFTRRLVVVGGHTGHEYTFTAGQIGDGRSQRDAIFYAWSWFANAHDSEWHAIVERMTGFSTRRIIDAWSEWQHYTSE
jgi:hypothetical protein